MNVGDNDEVVGTLSDIKKEHYIENSAHRVNEQQHDTHNTTQFT